MRVLAAILLCALLSPFPATARAAGTSGLAVRAQIVRDGVHLSLAMPRGPYARNSFVPVTARVVNVSDHTVQIDGTFSFAQCYVFAPVVEVQRQDGSTVFPPSVAGARPLPCPSPPMTGRALQPGAGITVHGYAILRAAHILATVELLEGRRTVTVSTPPATLSLRLMPAPRVSLQTAGPVFATLTRPQGARGPMLAAWWWSCANASPAPASGEEESRPTAVRAVGGTRLGPHLDRHYCGKLLEWHAVAGWSGFPAARLDYVSPASVPTPPTVQPRAHR